MAYIFCAIATEFPKTTSPYEVNKALIKATYIVVSYGISSLWNPGLTYCLENVGSSLSLALWTQKDLRPLLSYYF